MGTLKELGKASADVCKLFVAPQVGKSDLCDLLGYVENAGVPTSVTPDFIGQWLFDTSGLDFYIAFGTSQGNWAPTGINTVSLAELLGIDGLTATATQLNAAALAASSTRTITAIDSIVAADHNGTIFIDNATGFAITLPAPIAGFKCEVISKTANTSGNHTIVTNSSANIIKGLQNSVAGDAGDSGTADDTISFVANQSVAGDRVELRSDGTSWFAYATSKLAAGITFTQAS